VIAHLVLFKPRASLSDAERRQFLLALEHALVSIPSIARARVGRRRRLGRQYDQESSADFPFAALLEFRDEAGLRAYLDHPAHQSLGEQFYTASESALALDYDLIEADRVRDLLPERDQ
jgi:hypothetical protein